MRMEKVIASTKQQGSHEKQMGSLVQMTKRMRRKATRRIKSMRRTMLAKTRRVKTM